LSGKGNSVKEAPEAKATSPQFMRGEVRKCLESLGEDPKPNDLFLSKVKRRLHFVEACRCVTCKYYSNLRIGVKSQSSSEIAGSC
jgi:hypothetical protein